MVHVLPSLTIILAVIFTTYFGLGNKDNSRIMILINNFENRKINYLR